MPDHDLNIANQLFPATRTDLNSSLIALASNFSSATAPTNPQRGMDWYDITASPLCIWKKYDGTDWITMALVDETNNRFIPSGTFAGGIYAPAGGSANALTLTSSFPFSAYRNGMTIVLRVTSANTGGATLNVNALGAKTIKRLGGSDNLSAGDLAVGAVAIFIFDETQDVFQLINASFSQGVASEGGAGSIQICSYEEIYDTSDNSKAVTPRKLSAVEGGSSVVVASAATVNVETGNRRNVEVSGTTNISAFTAPTEVGIMRRVIFQNSLELQHSASFFLPFGGRNVTTNAGDISEWISTVAGWKCLAFYSVLGVLTVELEGGAASPGVNKYYGTDGAGGKGFFSLPAQGEVNTMSSAGGTSIVLTKSGVNLPIKGFDVVKTGTKPGGSYAISDFTYTIDVTATKLTFNITPTWTEFVPPPPQGGGD